MIAVRVEGCFYVALAILLAGLTGCVDDSVSTQALLDEPSAEAEFKATLELTPAGTIDGRCAVDLFFTRAPERPGPRMMELFVRPSGGLTYLEAETLAAATLADKQVVVQQQEDGTLRLLVFATDNLNRLDSGPLVRLAFSVSGGQATLELLERRPIFAPAEADFGITLGKSLSLGGN